MFADKLSHKIGIDLLLSFRRINAGGAARLDAL